MNKPNKDKLNPDFVAGELEHLRKLIDELENEYRWTYDFGYHKTFVNDVRVSGSGTSDPTGTIATSPFHSKARSRLKQALRLTQESIGNLSGALAGLKQITNEGDYQPSPAYDSFNERLITNEEYKEAKAYQAKREANRHKEL